MEAIGIILFLLLLVVYVPRILECIFCYVMERRYKKICEKKKESSNK